MNSNANYNLSPSSDAVYQAEYDSLKQSNIGLFEDAKKLILNNNTLLALQKLASMQSNNIIDQNKIFMGTLLANDYNPLMDVDGDTVEMVLVIAHQHPFYGGEAVYLARAMLHVTIEDVLPPLRRKKENKSSQNLKNVVQLFPNPAQSELYILSTNEFKEGDILVLANAFGSIVKSINLPSNQNNFSFDISQLTDGIYCARICNVDCINQLGKLTIIK